MRTPDFLIVGAAKSGTTSLSNYLTQHSDIKIVSNRLEHFGEYTNTMMPDLSEEEYLDLFKDIPTEKMAGEKSVSYLYSDKAPEQILRMDPTIKIFIILRNPVDRAYSDYWHRVRNGMETLSFKEAVDIEEQRISKEAPFEQHYTHYGLYSTKVENYFSLFGRTKCKVFLFEELVQNPQKVYKDSLEFLGVNPANTAFSFEIHNKGTVQKDNLLAKLLFKLSQKRSFVNFTRTFIPKRLKRIITKWMNTNTQSDGYPEMAPQIRKELIKFYERDIRKLEKILNTNLNRWLEN